MTSIAITPATPAHYPLILDSFWREYRKSPIARGVPPNILTGKMELLLSNANWSALVATPEDDTDTVIGYLVHRDATAHGAAPARGGSPAVAWLHTVRFWRERGVARALLAQAGIQRGTVFCAFLPPETGKEAATRGWVLRFRPYLPDLAAEETATRVAGLLDT